VSVPVHSGVTAASVAAASRFSWSVLTARGGLYQLCWCHGRPWAGTSGLETGDPFLHVTHDKPGSIEDVGHYFGFSTANADAVIGHSAWDSQTFEVGAVHRNATRSGVVVLFRNHPNCTAAGSCGRWDPPSSAAAGDWAIGDTVGVLPSRTPFSVRCSAPEDFQVTAGSLLVLGPTSANDTCIAGETCAVHGIEGVGLSDGDRLAVLDTCGVAGDHIPMFAGGDASVSATASGAIIAWSGPATPAGGIYRLCWCAVQRGTNRGRASRDRRASWTTFWGLGSVSRTSLLCSIRVQR
jgi:hypothetical protein